jgi:hypothetical protein
MESRQVMAGVLENMHAEKARRSRQSRENEPDPFFEIMAELKAFRDWAFNNPRMAFLVMGRFKANTQPGPEKMKKLRKIIIQEYV